MHHPTDRIAHATAFVKPVVEHWLKREIAQWVHPMKDRSDNPSHHERTLLPRNYISLLEEEEEEEEEKKEDEDNKKTDTRNHNSPSTSPPSPNSSLKRSQHNLNYSTISSVAYRNCNYLLKPCDYFLELYKASPTMATSTDATGVCGH